MLRGIDFHRNHPDHVLAEHVAGSEEAFANLMNDHAHRLGMDNTHFVNATGLPDPEHYTTPRDITVVSEAMIREFASQVDRLIVVEELDPFIEGEIRLMGIPVEGKSFLPLCGELNPSIVRGGAIEAGFAGLQDRAEGFEFLEWLEPGRHADLIAEALGEPSAGEAGQAGHPLQAPVRAGLGGGSSDAATTLVVLNRLWDCGLSPSELARLGLQLGAGLLLGDTTQAGKLYKWVDEHGQTRYGDRIPPQYAKKSNKTLNKQGVVVESKAAAKTQEQIAEEQRLAKRKAEQESKRQQQAHLDRILLDTFTNEDEMILTRDGKIEAIEAVIRVTNSRTEKIKQRLEKQQLRAANLERSGKAVSPKLQQGIRESRRQIRYNSDYVSNRRKAQLRSVDAGSEP